MKRVLSIVIFVFNLTHISAQLFTHAGGTVGFGQSKILGENSEFESVKAIQNFSIGLVGEHHFDSPFLVATEINFYGSGDSTILDQSFLQNNVSYTMTKRYKNMRYYLQIPICVGLNIPTRQEDSRVILKGGLYYSTLLGSRTTGKERLAAGVLVSDSMIDSRNFFPYPKNDFGLMASIGYGSDRYSIEFRFSRGLTSLFNQTGDLKKYNGAILVTLCGYILGAK